MAGLFTHKNASEKQKAREFVLKYYKGGNVLSLSADNFYFEDMLLKKRNNNQIIDCCECLKSAYLEGLKTFPLIKSINKNVTFNYINIFDVDFTKYDFIYLDLCCNLSVKTVSDIISSLQGFRGRIFITLQRGREQFKPSDLDAYGVPKKISDKERKAYFRDITFIELIECWTDLKQMKPRYDYQNIVVDYNKKIISRGSPMAVYSFEYKKIK